MIDHLGVRWLALRLFALALLLGGASAAQAADVSCSSFPLDANGFHVIDGNDPAITPATLPSSIGLDVDKCYFKNFPISSKWPGGLDIQSGPTGNINFDGNTTLGLTIFDNVYLRYNFSCPSTEQRIWFVNGSVFDPHNGLRNCDRLFFIAVEKVNKREPGPTATVGLPFTYTLTVPVMWQPSATGGGTEFVDQTSPNTLSNATIYDDLEAIGATYVGNTYTINGVPQGSLALWSGTPPNVGDPITGDSTKHIVFSYANNPALANIPAGTRIQIQMTVALDDVSSNFPGKTFTNTARWWFGRVIGGVAYEPLPGESGFSGPMTILAPPGLTLQKAGSPTNLNVGTEATFRLDVQNTGGSDAWNATVTDLLPSGMRAIDPTPTVTAAIYAADGTTLVSALTAGLHYVASYSAATGELRLTLADAVKLAPNQRLVVTYRTRLDPGVPQGVALTNVAGATQWFNAAVGTVGRRQFNCPLTNGTPGVLDCQDAFTVYSTIQGYFFLKSVSNLTTGAPVAATALPGDRLRYTLQFQNFTLPPLNNITVTDDLDALNATAVFVRGSLALASSNLPPGVTLTVNPTGGTKGTGSVTISGLSLLTDQQYQVQFDVMLAAALANGTTVLNQGQLSGVDNAGRTWSGGSDDPYVNGPSLLGAPAPDPTRTLISSGPLMQVRKVSQDMTGDPAVLRQGDRLRYTITVKNIGSENATGVSLRDLVPANTTYVAGSTTLNGTAVPDVGGASPLQAGLPIYAPENTTPGAMRADASATTNNVATIVFDVVVNAGVLDGTVISNQGFVNGFGTGSGAFAETPSDDPRTPAANDPTRDIVGAYPLLSARKTVALVGDSNGDGVLNPGDVVRYTISVDNLSGLAATGVVLTDLVPANTTYVAGSTTLNNVAVADVGGNSPLLPPGLRVNSPASASGTIAPRSSAVITFEVRVNAGVATGTVISNQGSVASTGLPSQPTDADGDSSNGYQPTTIVVGSAQQVSITKAVQVVGGGPALPGSVLEYLVTATNTGAADATNVLLTDDLGPLALQVDYVPGSATLNGSAAGVSMVGTQLRADYASIYGSLASGESARLRFRVQIKPGLANGTVITNSGQVAWNSPALTASASASITVGAVAGTVSLSGRVWHDADLDKAYDTGETPLPGWTVEVLRNNVSLGSVTTDANGQYAAYAPSYSATSADQFSLRFIAPGAGAQTAKLGYADSAFTNGPQAISGITVPSGSGSVQNLNLPLQPNGVAYDSMARVPVAGATLTLVRAGSTLPLPLACFDDPAQQGQVTLANGYYKFDLNFGDPSCPSGGTYLIQVAPPAAYMPGISRVIPPVSHAGTVPFSVPSCPGTSADAVPATGSYCEAQASEFAPGAAVPAGRAATNHYLNLTFNSVGMPGTSQIYNNHIAIDPRLANAVTITKVVALRDVTRGQLVPYTITVTNTLPVTLTGLNVVDTFPAGFKYVPGSGRIDGQAVEPTVLGNQLTWNLQLAINTKRVIQLMLIVGSGVGEGQYVNRAQVFAPQLATAASGEATATVRVVADPTLDCSDVIGKVFDDVNMNGVQDDGEPGLPGVRVVTARGLIVTTDAYGRFHLTCASVPDPDRGSNFIVKLDDRSLPTGYRITTENPLVQRATRGKMIKFNFGAALHRVVKLDVADGVFEPGTVEMRIQWKQRMKLLQGELKKAPSLLRLSYLAEIESESLVKQRLEALKREIAAAWKHDGGRYDLTVETEVFWRTGRPAERAGN